MEDYPQNQIEFAKRFDNEEACHKYLFTIRWPYGFKCPQCGNSTAWPTRRHEYRCSECNRQTSITSGTIFHRTRKPLQLWFQLMWSITSQKYGANALGVQRVLGLGSYHTAWEWLHKLRRAMVRPGREKLSGVVEVDETYVGGQKSGKRGRGAEGKALVMIAVEDKNELGFGRIRLGRVEDASSYSLTRFIEDNVEAGSTVRTDGWNGYNSLSEKGYEHVVQAEMGDVGEEMLPLAHRIASLMKRWLMGTYQGAVREQHLDYYLDEYTFRFNRRTSASRGKLFYRLVQQAMLVDPVPANQIVGETGAQNSGKELKML
jgi:transposase-like protein